MQKKDIRRRKRRICKRKREEKEENWKRHSIKGKRESPKEKKNTKICTREKKTVKRKGKRECKKKERKKEETKRKIFRHCYQPLSISFIYTLLLLYFDRHKIRSPPDNGVNTLSLDKWIVSLVLDFCHFHQHCIYLPWRDHESLSICGTPIVVDTPHILQMRQKWSCLGQDSLTMLSSLQASFESRSFLLIKARKLNDPGDSWKKMNFPRILMRRDSVRIWVRLAKSIFCIDNFTRIYTRIHVELE